MKRIRSILALLLCAALAAGMFSACGKTGGNDAATTYGRYVEEDITPEGLSGMPSSFVSFSDGTLDIISVDWGDATDENALQSYKRWRSTDGGKTWENVDISWTEEYIHDYSDYYEKGESPPEEVGLGSIVPCENGDVLYQVYTWITHTDEDGNQGQTHSSEFFRITPAGEKSTFALEGVNSDAEGGSFSVSEVRSLPGNRLYVSLYMEPTAEQMRDPGFDWNSTEQRAVYDQTSGKKLYDLDFSGWETFTNETTLFANDYEHGFKAFNLEDGSPADVPMPSQEALQRLMQGNVFMGSTFADADGNFYNISARGMTRYPAKAGGAASAPESGSASTLQVDAPEGASATTGAAPESADPNKGELVMDGLNYTYGSPLYGISSVVYNPGDKSITMALYDSSMDNTGDTGKLLRYVWDDEAVATSDKKIKVFSLYDNYTVRLGLSEFKRQNPDVTIELETAYDTTRVEQRMNGDMMEDGENSNAKTEEDILRELNTELLNGTGPDVLIMDGLPADSFIGKGVLLDLSAEVQAVEGGVFPAIFDPLTQDGKIYTVPANFFIPTLLGEKGYVEQFTSYSALMDAIEQGPGNAEAMELSENATPEEYEAYYQAMNKPKTEEEQPVLGFPALDDAFEALYTISAPAIISETGGINEANLKTFLESMKTVSDKYRLADPEAMGMMGGGSISMSNTGYAAFEFSQTLSNYCNRLSRLGYSRLGSLETLYMTATNLHWAAQPDEDRYGMAMGGVAVVDDADAADAGEEGMMQDEDMPADTDTSTPASEPATDESAAADTAATDSTAEETAEGENAAADETPRETLPARDTLLELAPGLEGGVYIPAQLMGVTSTSKQPELAKAFVAAMLNNEVQKHDMSNGLPVTVTAMKQQVESAQKRNEAYMKREGIAYIPFDYEALLTGVNTPLMENDFLSNVIKNPAISYCNGEMPLEAAVEQIVKETELYFAERQ